jgi:UDP-N-acetylglucosamine acyltransferase
VAIEPLAYAGVNSVGLRRRGFSNEVITEIQDIYRYVYQRGLNISQAVAMVEAEMEETEERDIILNFIKSSERGIVRGVEE